MTKTIIIGHKIDLDGIAAHAILERKNPDARHIYVDYPELMKALRGIANAKDTNIFVVDIKIDKENIPEIIKIFQKLKRSNCSINWIDHHQWKPDEVAKLAKVITLTVYKSKSAADMCRELFMSKDKISKKLGMLAKNYKLKLASKLVKVISSGCSYSEIVNRLANGNLWDDYLNSWYVRYLNIEYAELKKIEKNAIVKKLSDNDLTIAIGFIRDISASAASAYLLKKFNADFSAIVSLKNKKIVFRTANPRIDMVTYAEGFGGGGHKHAAGGFIKGETKRRVIKEIFEKIGKLR